MALTSSLGENIGLVSKYLPGGDDYYKLYQKPIRVETCNSPLCAGKQASEYSICYYKVPYLEQQVSEEFLNMVLSTETFNQSVRAEYSEAVNVRLTRFNPYGFLIIHNGTYTV